MNSVQRISVYAFCFSLFALAPSYAAFAKESKESTSLKTTNTVSSDNNSNVNNRASTAGLSEFQWDDHKTLSWEDFRGPVNAVTDESAAATHCGIGFKTSRSAADGKTGIIVYNTFYVNKSWVRHDARIPEILVHEQGHFDLCELYTRQLRKRMANIDLEMPNLRATLERIYFEVKSEYENRQQAYERETTHGTNFAQQGRWHDVIAKELNAGENANSRYVSSGR